MVRRQWNAADHWQKWDDRRPAASPVRRRGRRGGTAEVAVKAAQAGPPSALSRPLAHESLRIGRPW